MKRLIYILLLILAVPLVFVLGGVAYYRFWYTIPSVCTAGDCVNGVGRLMYENGNVYSGQFLEGKYNGAGIFTSLRGDRYEGDWEQGEKHGNGRYVYPDGSSYSGSFEANKKHGFGIFTWEDGTEYRGHWNEGEPHGEGELVLTDGQRLEGQYENGIVVDGSGIFIYENGDRYVGQWRDGERNGNGILFNVEGDIMFAGAWQDDEPTETQKSNTNEDE